MTFHPKDVVTCLDVCDSLEEAQKRQDKFAAMLVKQGRADGFFVAIRWHGVALKRTYSVFLVKRRPRK